MSRRRYVLHCEWFELKLLMRGEEGLLTNLPKFQEITLLVPCFRSVVAKLTGQTSYMSLLVTIKSQM